MQDRIDAIHLKLGELEGRQKEQANVLKEISKSLAILASNTTKVEELDKARIQHDKRIVLLENTCSARGVTLDKLEMQEEEGFVPSLILSNSFIVLFFILFFLLKSFNDLR